MATHIVFVLDRSGSMRGMESDVIGGFNSFLAEQQKLKDKANLTTVLFDNEYEVLHDGINIQDVKPITEKDYYVRGMTALLDAIGKAINVAKSHVKKKDKVLVVINTDGFENASKEYSATVIKDMIKELENSKQWNFMFLGAGIDEIALAGTLGIATSASYSKTGAGNRSVYSAVSQVTSCYRVAPSATLDTDGLKSLT